MRRLLLAAMVLELIPSEQEVVVPTDDTNTQHTGKRVYGKARHHECTEPALAVFARMRKITGKAEAT